MRARHTWLILGFVASLAAPPCVWAGSGAKLPEPSEAVIKPIAVSTENSEGQHRRLHARVLINAPSTVVWDAVHEERQHDPDMTYSKIVTKTGNESTIEQKFDFVPLIGSATCLMHNRETPLQRIEYHLIKSDHLKALEGTWTLSPGPDQNSTWLDLTSYADIGLPIPRLLIDGLAAKKLQRRLANVKVMAEATQSRLAHTSHLN